MSSFHLGGAETALLGLLEAIDYNKYDIDLFLYRHEGELLPYLPKKVNLLPEDSDYACLAESVQQTFKRGKFILGICKVFGLLLARLKYPGANQASINADYLHKYVCPLLPLIKKDKEYDLAISFIFPHYIVPTKVCAKKKIAWIHTDYTSVIMDVQSQLKMWEKYEKIISISESVSLSFEKVFPSLSNRLEIIENILPESYIREKANEQITDLDEYLSNIEIKLLSIGRFSYPKNFDNVPYICKQILNQGINIRWFLIGYGDNEKLIREKIKENEMQNNVIILGKKDNPYPYIKKCDIYIQPSRFEGKSVAVREAQLLRKPVIITAYPTSKSQLKDGVDGFIVPLDIEDCVEGIIKLIQSKELLKEIINNCKNKDFSMKDEIKKIYKIIEN